MTDKRRGPPETLRNFKTVELDRRVHRHVDPQLGDDAVLGVLEDAVAKAVADDVRRGAAGRQRRGRPELAGLLVADVERLAAGVLDRIVVPGREPKLVAFSAQV